MQEPCWIISKSPSILAFCCPQGPIGYLLECLKANAFLDCCPALAIQMDAFSKHGGSIWSLSPIP